MHCDEWLGWSQLWIPATLGVVSGVYAGKVGSIGYWYSGYSEYSRMVEAVQ